MRQLLYLVRQNLKRKRFRTAVMVCSIALACATLFLAVTLSKGIQNTLQVATQRMGADIVVVPRDSVEEAESALISGNPTSFYMPANTEEKIRTVAGVDKTSPQVFLRSLDAPCCIAQVALVGYAADRDLTVGPWVLQNTGKPLQDNQIIVGAKVISSVVGTPSRAIGQRLIFMGKPFSVATILEPTGLGTDFTVFVNMSVAYAMMRDSPLYPVPVKEDQISTVLVKVKDGETPSDVAARIEKNIPEVRSMTANQLTRSVGGQMEHLVGVLYAAGGVFCLLAIVLAGSLFSLSVRQRMREFGLFRAMGARRDFISRLVVLEAVCIAGIGALLGILAGGALVFFGKEIIVGMIGNMYMWPEPAYFLKVAGACMLVSLITGIAGGLFPARRVRDLDIYESIRKGE